MDAPRRELPGSEDGVKRSLAERAVHLPASGPATVHASSRRLRARSNLATVVTTLANRAIISLNYPRLSRHLPRLNPQPGFH